MKFALFLLLTFVSSLHGAEIAEERTTDLWKESPVSAAIKHNLLQEYDLLTSDGERDILSVLFRENVLVLSDTDFLIRLYETEMRGKTILPGRKREIENALRKKIERDHLEAIAIDLAYAHSNGFEHAFILIIETISDRFGIFLDYISGLDGFSENCIQDLKIYRARFTKPEEDEDTDRFSEDSDADYVFVTDSDLAVTKRPRILVSDFMDLSSNSRLPAVIRYITEIDFRDKEVTSSFIRNNVIDRFDLSTVLTLYQVEMMDNYHTHDTEGVIEKHLKHKSFVEGNEIMARLALQMFVEGHDTALKLIIDEKFSYMSPFTHPLWFKDLLWLFTFASENHFPEYFFTKVLSIAKPSVVRRYVSRIGIENISAVPTFEEISDVDFEDEDIKVVNFYLK